MIKKLLTLTLILVTVAGFVAFSSPFHAELDTALVTDIGLRSASFSNTFRIGAKGNNYSLDVAMAYNPESNYSRRVIKGIGPSFSLDAFDITFQLDSFVWPNEYAKATLKYKISDLVNVGTFAQSDLSYNYHFGILLGIEV